MADAQAASDEAVKAKGAAQTALTNAQSAAKTAASDVTSKNDALSAAKEEARLPKSKSRLTGGQTKPVKPRRPLSKLLTKPSLTWTT